jgi:hypothetical protein
MDLTRQQLEVDVAQRNAAAERLRDAGELY